MAEQIKMLFGVNTPGGHGTLLDVGPDLPPPHKEGKGATFKFWDPLIFPEG